MWGCGTMWQGYNLKSLMKCDTLFKQHVCGAVALLCYQTQVWEETYVPVCIPCFLKEHYVKPCLGSQDPNNNFGLYTTFLNNISVFCSDENIFCKK